MCASAARVGLVHIGVFILLLMSGERNFGVRLNKPYTLRVPMDIPVFTGTHADLLIVVRSCEQYSDRISLYTQQQFHILYVQVFHKIMTCGQQRLHILFDCLLTIIVNSKYYG